jgi:hypothetical protein
MFALLHVISVSWCPSLDLWHLCCTAICRHGVGKMRTAIKTRHSFSGRKMTDDEVDTLCGNHEGIAALLDLVSTSCAALQSGYRCRTLTVPAMHADTREGGVANQQRDSAGARGWGGECLAGLAEERTASDGRLLRSVRVLRRSVARLLERASFLLDRSSSSEAYFISMG